MKVRLALSCMPLALAVLIFVGCDDATTGDIDIDTSRPAHLKPSEFGFQKPTMTSLVEEGELAYAQYCSGCHGESGDGRGSAAGFFSPIPRNFQKANFKFSSTRSGQLPLDSDLERTIRNGLKGSAMPAFRWLPQRTVDSLVAYIKTFSDKWKERVQPQPIPNAIDPYRTMDDKSEAIARGEMIYHGYATCWSCHPSYVSDATITEYRKALKLPVQDFYRIGIELAEGKVNTEGEMIYPPDFYRDFVRSGANIENLYRSIAAGITGTAMPTWVDSMDYPDSDSGDALVTPSDLWAMAYYVQHLITHRPDKLAEGKFALRDRTKNIYLDPSQIPVYKPEEKEELEEDVEMDLDF